MPRPATRRSKRSARVAFATAIMWLTLVQPASADDGEIAARQAQQRELERAALALRKDVEALRSQLVRTASRIQARERSADADEARLGDLKLRRHAAAANFDRRRGELTDLVGALERVARRPPALLLAEPGATADHARGAMLLGAIIGTLEKDAAALRVQLGSLDQLRTRIGEEQAQLDISLAGLRAEKARLTELVSQKNRQRAEFTAGARAEAAEIAGLAIGARTTGDLLSRIKARQANLARNIAPAPRPAGKTVLIRPEVTPRPNPSVDSDADIAVPDDRFVEARGNVMQPAAGRIVAAYGRPDGAGGVRKGINIQTRESAEVVAPFAGKVVFAGPFGDYGELLILEAGEGYHILLSGMSSVHGVVGQFVVPGEPIGRMGIPAPGAGGVVKTAAGAAGDTSDLRDLYVEFRKDGEPFNPLPWMAPGKDKVSG